MWACADCLHPEAPVTFVDDAIKGLTTSFLLSLIQEVISRSPLGLEVGGFLLSWLIAMATYTSPNPEEVINSAAISVVLVHFIFNQ